MYNKRKKNYNKFSNLVLNIIISIKLNTINFGIFLFVLNLIDIVNYIIVIDIIFNINYFFLYVFIYKFLIYKI
jgi:hypothetical protein